MTAAPTGYSAHQRRVFCEAFEAYLRLMGGNERDALELAHAAAEMAPRRKGARVG